MHVLANSHLYKTVRCEPSALWADGLSSRLEGGAFGKDVGVGDDGGSSGSRGEDEGWRNCG